MTSAAAPLSGPPPPEIPLSNPPLVRVIAQVRFPLIASLERREFIASFQEAIRRRYPVLHPDLEQRVVLGPRGVVKDTSNTAWRFREPDGAWQLTLAPDFLALDTTRYSSRDDFINRFEVALRALQTHIDPGVVDRLGIRYIDRISGESLAVLGQLIRPEVAGILGSSLAASASQVISEHIFDLPGSRGRMRARWGLLPAQSTVDPAALSAISEPSWILDADAFQSFAEGTHRFSVDQLVEQARGFSERIYGLFRWVVTDEFIARYGGTP